MAELPGGLSQFIIFGVLPVQKNGEGMSNILILGMTEFFLVLFLVLAYMIKVKGRVEIIAGYEAARVKDKKGLADFVGNSLIILAVSACIAFIFEIVNPVSEFLIFMFFASVVVPVVGIATFLRSREFFKKEVPEKKVSQP